MSLPPKAYEALARSTSALRLLSHELRHHETARAHVCDEIADDIEAIMAEASIEQAARDRWEDEQEEFRGIVSPRLAKRLASDDYRRDWP